LLIQKFEINWKTAHRCGASRETGRCWVQKFDINWKNVHAVSGGLSGISI